MHLVIWPASSAIKLSAADFPPAEVRHNNQGQSFLVTERQIRPDRGRLNSIAIAIHDLPTPGPGRLIATLLATLGIGFGLWQSLQRRMTARGGTAGPRDPRTRND